MAMRSSSKSHFVSAKQHKKGEKVQQNGLFRILEETLDFLKKFIVRLFPLFLICPVVLKDVSSTVMKELLQFMYQGELSFLTPHAGP